MIHAVIMAGGKGTRFWPLSRSDKPKQFLSVIGDQSLLEQTIQRLVPDVPSSQIWIMGNMAHKKWLKPYRTFVPASQFLLEPMGKNTAACIGWAAIELLKRDPDATMVVMPADHYVSPVKSFQRVIHAGVKCVEKNPDTLITIGIVPEFAHTGYGYIEVGEGTSKEALQVKAFHEKPSFDTAQAYVQKGSFYWNSGIFIWKATTILSLFEKWMPAHYALIQELGNLKKGLLYSRRLKAIFEKFDNISIDYGIMEKAYSQTQLIPSEFSWSDIGSWSSLESFWKKDEFGNAFNGKVLTLDSQNNLVYSPQKTVALIGVEGLTVIDSDDAILIVPTSQDQKIKDLVAKLPPSLT